MFPWEYIVHDGEMIIAGPKVVMASDKQMVDRLAVRALENGVDLSKVQIAIRPFVES